MLKPSKPLSIGLGIAGVVIFCITSLMIRNAGMSAAATGEGQALRGYGNIAIHVTGLVLFGMATGYLFRAKMRVFGCLTGIVVIGTALLSMKNLVDFAAIEQTSITKARQTQIKAQDDVRKANLEAQKKKQENVVKMTEGTLSWLKSTTKDADGRRERKDSMEQANKLITEYAKAEIPMIEAPKAGEVILQTDGGTELISKATGLDKEFIELLGNLYQNFMLIMMESIIWPLAAFFWPSKETADTVTAALALSAAVAATVDGNGKQQRLLSAPSRSDPKVLTVRMEPTAEWRKMLDQIDYPPNGSRHKGPERPRIDADKQALRFLCWASAYNERGEISADELESLYSDFLNADHRELTASRQVKGELESIKRGKFASKRQVPGRGTLWKLDPPPLDVMQQLLEKAGMVKPEPFTVTQVAALPEVKTGGDAKSSSIIPFWRSRTAGGGLH